MKCKPVYFLFGSEACKFVEDNSMKEFIELIERKTFYDIWAVHKFTDPVQLLSAYDGWYDFMVIKKKHFNKLNKL